jgi:hypothetical protein
MSGAMTESRQLRTRAQKCLEVASQLSDRQAADELRRQAADFHARATALEAAEGAELRQTP